MSPSSLPPAGIPDDAGGRGLGDAPKMVRGALPAGSGAAPGAPSGPGAGGEPRPGGGSRGRWGRGCQPAVTSGEPGELLGQRL